MKRYFKWTFLRLVLIFGLIIFLFSFTGQRNKLRGLDRVEVDFTSEEALFLTHEAVNKLLIENTEEPSRIKKVDLDLNTLEQTIDNHPMIEKSEVFVSVDGVLKAVVKQKTPIGRVLGQDGGYYIDYKGGKMPLSEYHSARVPVVSGEINDKNIQQLTQVLQRIYSDAFLKKNITGISVSPGGNLQIKNRGFDYKVEFGKMINVDRKFNNYIAFMQKAVRDSTIYQYKKINLKFTQQVVCTK